MPSRLQHIEQYEKNKSLANSKHIRQPQFKDWRIVIIFYATMHYLESFYSKERHFKSHIRRKEYLESTLIYDTIVYDYENLEMLSRKSRYDCVNILDKEVTDALINMKAVEDFVNDPSNQITG